MELLRQSSPELPRSPAPSATARSKSFSRPIDGVDAIYWINLDRCTDRRRHLETVLSDPIFDNIPKIRIKGIDGKGNAGKGNAGKGNAGKGNAGKGNAGKGNAGKGIDDDIDLYANIPSRRMTTSEYGCTLSHLTAIHEFAKTDLPVALILEDDVCLDFKPYWRKSMKEIALGAPKDWEILQLSYIMFDFVPSAEYESADPFTKNLCSTAAYMISNSAAKRLMADIYKSGKFDLSDNTPHQADRYLYLKCKTYTYKYSPFIYRTDNDSEIHPDHVQYHTENKRKIENMLMQRDNGLHSLLPYWNEIHIWFLLLFFALLIFTMCLIGHVYWTDSIILENSNIT